MSVMERTGSGPRGADDWVERVRAASDIVEVVGQTVQLKRVGRNWVGLCPFHQEKTPSFSVNAERQFYHCFSCKVGGDVFKFIQETENVGFLEAVELLSRRAGIPVPERRAGERGKRAPLLEALDAAATAYEQWLADPTSGAAARAYLERRGITRDTWKAFRIGLAPEGWEHLTGRLGPKFADEVLIEARLASRRDTGRGLYDWFRNRLMVPLVLPGGAVVGFGARAMGDDQPKYLNSPESAVYHKGQFLFALEQARKHVRPDDEVIVVEGYFDAMALHQHGIRNTVATSGTALTAEQARLLRRMARGVALTYDGDAAGQDAMMRSLGVLLAEGLDVVVLELPAGDDPDTLVRRDGPEGWNALRQAACDPVEFVQRHVLQRGAGGDPRERALHAIVRLAAGVSDTIRYRLLVERASQVFGLAEAAIARAVQLQRAGQKSDAPIEAVLKERRRIEEDLERRTLRALLHDPAALPAARERLEPEDFRDPACAELARMLWNGEPALPTEGPAAALARELLGIEGEDAHWNAEALGGIRKLVERRLKQDLKDRTQRLRTATGGEAERLLLEMNEIARSLRELTS